LEAVETIIYLNEIMASGRQAALHAAVTPEDYGSMLLGRKPPLASPEMGDEFFPRLCDQPWDEKQKALTRYGCKMATGSGKTVVMAMLTWPGVLQSRRGARRHPFPERRLGRVPQSHREGAPASAPHRRRPGEELLRPSSTSCPRSSVRACSPSVGCWSRTGTPSLPRAEHAEGGATYAVVQKGEEGADAFARRVLRDLYGRGECARVQRRSPPRLPARSAGRSGARPRKRRATTSAFGAATDDDQKEATVWVEGLDKLNASVGVRCCIDLSATPFYLGGSGYIEGSPFPWLVSDFGLVDAIESGITKIPRLPVADTSGRPDPKFFRLWEEIKRQLKAQGDANFDRGKPKPEATWRQAQPALATCSLPSGRSV
jgi:type III restriction enzyme